ncbi:ribulose-phosphate 3-epimerase [Breznakia pachnodae]|uniref:Ribulose-phosphate 3-epimerase n=1 Tax=Breznakia pachnodae TaxID=265178 RepID=A0ABU0DYH8_9FIRM|nr:ribulose-phosphate 3-epimerase [Breznakia pachnodae]MDQ0359636.1 ribulose-phosphate 3-epimerase [Breznakia pachnodae]
MEKINLNKEILVSGSLSCCDILNLENEIEKINQSDLDFIHYDVVDGEFNKCFVFGDLVLEKIRPYVNKPIEVHLAVNDIDKYLEPFIKAGADYIAVHYEIDCNHKEVFEKIRRLGAKPILAFKSVSDVPEDFIELAKEVDWILKLTVNPGFAGQKIQSAAIEHIKIMRERLSQAGLTTHIQADGNIHSETIPSVVEAGATILTGGTSGLFRKNTRIQDNIDEMRQIAGEHYE